MDYNCTIKVEGETTEELLIALDEVKRLLDEGYYSGFDSNETGSYEFEMTNQEIRNAKSSNS